METKSVDFVFLNVNANKIPPINVKIITKVFLKNICAKENNAAFTIINNALLLNKDS